MLPGFTANCSNFGIDIGETSVGKYMVRQRKPPSQTWRTFLENHLKTMVSVDLFTVPTIRFQILYVFLVLAHDRRRILHFGVTAHHTAEWTMQQLREAFPFDQVPRYLLRDRDGIFGAEFGRGVQAMQVEEVLSAPRSPWQRAYVERVIGTIRRECLDHVIVFNEASLYRHVRTFLAYYYFPWPRMHQRHGRCLRRRRDASSPSRKLAHCTTATSGAQPEAPQSRPPTAGLFHCRPARERHHLRCLIQPVRRCCPNHGSEFRETWAS